jgi:hypothetical protein
LSGGIVISQSRSPQPPPLVRLTIGG